MANKVKLSLKGSNWDTLNKVLNESAPMQSMLDSIADEIADDVEMNISSGSGSGSKKFHLSQGIRKTVGEPIARNGLRVRFVSIPSLGYEAQYGVLRGALDGIAE